MNRLLLEILSTNEVHDVKKQQFKIYFDVVELFSEINNKFFKKSQSYLIE